MRIAKVTLKDFRLFENAEIVLDQPLSIIRGHNHSGKSSIARAIQLALSHRTDDVADNGAGANDDIRNGASKAEINVDMAGKSGAVGIRTTYGPNKTGRDQSFTGPAPSVEALQKKLESDRARFRCCLDSHYFLGTDEKTRRAVLASLVIPPRYDFDAAIVEIATKRLGTFAWDKSPVALIDQVYGAAYDARKAAKAALGAIYVPAVPQRPEHAAEAVQIKLIELRARAAKESKKKAPGTVQLGRAEKELEQLEAKLKESEEEQEGAQQELQQVNGEIFDQAGLRKHEKTAAGRTLYIQLQEKIDAASREIEDYDGAVEVYMGLLEDPCCPTCTQVITKEFIDLKIGQIRTEKQECIEGRLALMKEQQGLGDILGSEKALRENVASAEKKKGIQNELSALSTTIATLSTQIIAAKAQLEDAKAAEASPVDTTVIDSLNTEIAAWEKQLTPAIQYESTLKQIETGRAQQDAKKSEVSDLEKLCSYFGKDGIKATLIQENLEGFKAQIDNVLQAWGYESKLDIEAGEFSVLTPTGWVKATKISGSEKMFFKIALQAAIAVFSKIRMIVVDPLDEMIDTERKKAFACINGMLKAGTLDQAILVEANVAEAASREGVAYYRVADGKVAKL